MKILNREQIKLADEYTIKNEPIASIDLMERASQAFTNLFESLYHNNVPIHILCGVGNNGGDGLAISRILIADSYDVTTYVVKYSANFSQDFLLNEKRLTETTGAKIIYVDDDSEMPVIPDHSIVIDALWGTGLTRPINGLGAKVIEHINNSSSTVVAVDIPSGVFCDDINSDPVIIKASHTISFQAPKYSFFMPENEEYVGECRVVDIGLNAEFIDAQISHLHQIDTDLIQSIYKPRKKFAHKGHFGHALIFSGSYGKIGASVLASKCALRSGAGLVTAYIPQCGYEVLQSSLPECMVLCDDNYEFITSIPDLKPFNSIGVGPGLGQDALTMQALNKLLINYDKPMVFDADGINILAQNPELINQLPEYSILTPHIGEFDRLVGKSSNQYERLGKLVEFSSTYKYITILKGHNTAVCLPDGRIYFNCTGNPGMATGGSGDVLTGLITGLLAQKYNPVDAALLGVYVHGMAGDFVASNLSEEGMIAGDIVEALPAVFKILHHSNKKI
jgi:ADP-dependent NAD(P)H-hydrate dehydratase / NAD(P)H-hydrate epimerase